MLTLAINTATQPEAIALFDGKKLLAEKSWEGHADETEKLLANIQKILKTSKKSWGDLRQILAVRGPGQFTALRIGVAVANALAFSLGIPLFETATPIFKKSFGKTMMELKKKSLRRCKTAIPVYSLPPNITKAKSYVRI